MKFIDFLENATDLTIAREDIMFDIASDMLDKHCKSNDTVFHIQKLFVEHEEYLEKENRTNKVLYPDREFALLVLAELFSTVLINEKVFHYGYQENNIEPDNVLIQQKFIINNNKYTIEEFTKMNAKELNRLFKNEKREAEPATFISNKEIIFVKEDLIFLLNELTALSGSASKEHMIFFHQSNNDENIDAFVLKVLNMYINLLQNEI